MLHPRLAVRTVASGLTTPISSAFLGPSDMFVLEKNTGRVLRVVDGVIGPTVLDLAVNFASQRGLLRSRCTRAFPTPLFGGLFVGFSVPEHLGGPLFRFNLTGNRNRIAVDDPRLEDRVSDNLTFHDLRE